MKRNRAKETYDQLRNPQKRIKLSLRTRLPLACILFISTIFGKIYILAAIRKENIAKAAALLQEMPLCRVMR